MGAQQDQVEVENGEGAGRWEAKEVVEGSAFSTPLMVWAFICEGGAGDLGIAAAQDNTDVVRCLLAHGADAGVVDLSACAEESAALLREVLSDAAASDAKAGGSPGAAPLWPAERDSFASDAFRQLAPALVATLGSAHSPKLHKRVLMVLAYLVRRASAPRLAALSPLQLGAPPLAPCSLAHPSRP